MNRTAQVHSIEAIEQFRGSLNLFGEEVGQALSAVRTDLQRFQHWLEHDQLKHWQHQIRVREERVAEAKGDLHRCLSATIDPNRTPSCLQEKKLLAAAKARLEEAERKLAAVRHWIQTVRQAVVDYHARAEPLATVATADIPRAAAELTKTIDRLTAYLELSASSAEAPNQASMSSPRPSETAAAPDVTKDSDATEIEPKTPRDSEADEPSPPQAP